MSILENSMISAPSIPQSRKQRTVDEIAGDYARAETTVFWLHDPALGHRLLFAVVELCPVEQPKSDPIYSVDANGNTWPMRRCSLGDRRNLCASRLVDQSVAEGLSFYRGSGGVRRLSLTTGPADLDPIQVLSEEPPDEFPALVAERGEELYQSVLPVRPTNLRVCSRFAQGAAFLTGLSPYEQSLLKTFSTEVLGVDLVVYAEHLGAVHLCMANPLLRSIHHSLGRDDRLLLVEMYERIGRSVDGCRMRLTDHRHGGVGFDFEIPADSSRLIVQMPYSPQELEVRLYGGNGELLTYSRSGFIRQFRLDMGLMGHERRIDTKNAVGELRTESVRTVTWDKRGTSNDDSRNALSVMAEAIDRRMHLREAKTFHFFEGGLASRDRARTVLRDLIGEARDRCLLCDPYLSADDVSEYATFATTRGIVIRLLATGKYLHKDARDKNLENRLRLLSSQDPSLRFDCRIFKQNLVHDRFLMLDQHTYVIGSSLAELGSRATTIYRIPQGAGIDGALEGWWNDDTLTESLATWLGSKVE